VTKAREPFTSQLNLGYIPASPLLPSKKPRFKIPVRSVQAPVLNKTEEVPDNIDFAKQRNSTQVPSFLTKDQIHQVQNLVEQSNNYGAQKVNVCGPRLDDVLPKGIQSPSPLMADVTLSEVIPETPAHQGMSQVRSLLNDQRSKKHVFGPVLQTPSRLQLPSFQTPGGSFRAGSSLRSVDEICILGFVHISQWSKTLCFYQVTQINHAFQFLRQYCR